MIEEKEEAGEVETDSGSCSSCGTGAKIESGKATVVIWEDGLRFWEVGNLGSVFIASLAVKNTGR